MELPFPAEERQRQQGEQGRRAEPEVHRDRQPGVGPAQGPQAVVVEAQQEAQGSGPEELQGLRLHGVFHQPSSRRRKPPSGRACS